LSPCQENEAVGGRENGVVGAAPGVSAPVLLRRRADGESASDRLSWARAHLAVFDPLAGDPAGVFKDLPKITAWTYRA
jgi:hypothetical protein